MQGRSKSFDAILNDHKAEKEALVRAKAEALGQGQQQPDAAAAATAGLLLSPAKTPVVNRPNSLQIKPFVANKLAKTPSKALAAPAALSVARTVTVTSSSSPLMSTANRCQKLTSPVLSNSHNSSIATATVSSVRKQLPFTNLQRFDSLHLILLRVKASLIRDNSGVRHVRHGASFSKMAHSNFRDAL